MAGRASMGSFNSRSARYDQPPQQDEMKRRRFLTIFGGLAVTWPLLARAQQRAKPIVGFLRSGTLADVPHWVEAFGQGLKEAGLIEKRDVAIEYHSAYNQPARLAAQIAELIRRPATVMVGNADAALAAKKATTAVPIVFATGGDPIHEGLVTSLNRPGGNVTGVSFFSAVLGGKRLELLRQIAPGTKTIAVLVNLKDAPAEAERRDVQDAARAIGQPIVIFDVSNASGIEAAFAAFSQHGVAALLVGTGGFLNSQRAQIAALADRYVVPAIYSQREGVDAGGLMSYGTNISDAYRQVGLYAARIVKGEKPAELPVIQATKFEFVLNRRTARKLGIDVPDRLLTLADEVVE
jgi:putative ABC transport system substrate-binding protein